MVGLGRKEPASLAAAYDRYGAAAYSVLVRITRNRASAEDLLQELFLRVWDRACYFDPSKGSLGVWVLSIARNMALDHLRAAPTRLTARLSSLSHLHLLCYCHPSNARLSVVENAVFVRAALANLTPLQQRVLELAYFEGCSQAEIARRLQVPLGTVKSWTRAALRHLRLLMTQQSSGGTTNNREQQALSPVLSSRAAQSRGSVIDLGERFFRQS